MGLISLTLPLNGDPIDPEVLDNFAFEIRSRFRDRKTQSPEVKSDTKLVLRFKEVISGKKRPAARA